jgi:hypothetical protein
MKLWLYLAASAATFAGLGKLALLDVVPSALVQVAFGVLMAVFASGALTTLSVAGGALGALAFGALAPVSPALGGAAFLACVFFERTTRIAQARSRSLHLGLAILGGALAAQASVAFAGVAIATLSVALLVSAALTALPFFVDCDDPITHKLSVAAKMLKGDLAKELGEAAELRRQTMLLPLEASSKDTVESSWSALATLVEGRMLATRSGESDLLQSIHAKTEEKILEVIRNLRRTLTVSAKVRAAEPHEHDDVAVRLEATGDSLEEVGRAMGAIPNQEAESASKT